MANEVKINQREATDNILNRVTEMQNDGLSLPTNYNASNALNIAFLELSDMKVKGKPLLEVVTKKSVYESLLNMVLQGLSPAKNQLYFIPYGNELQMQRSYFGTQTALKRLKDVKDIWANVIFEADQFEMMIDQKGRERLVNHKTNFLNRDGEIVGAYAIIDTQDDGQLLTVMTKKEIDASWSQGKTSNVHNKFPQEMAKRTVLNRAAKNFINSSDDSDLLIQALNQTTENEYEDEQRAKDISPAKEEKTNDLLANFKAEKQEEEQPKKETNDESETAENQAVDIDYEEVEESPAEEKQSSETTEIEQNSEEQTEEAQHEQSELFWTAESK